MPEIVHAGGCLCGGVRFEARGAPDRVVVCHCETCRKNTGAPFVVLAVWPKSAVTVTGETRGYRSSPPVDRRGCPTCGAQVLITGEGEKIELYTGAMDDPAPFVPEYEIFTVHRPGWLPPLAGLPTYERAKP